SSPSSPRKRGPIVLAQGALGSIKLQRNGYGAPLSRGRRDLINQISFHLRRLSNVPHPSSSPQNETPRAFAALRHSGFAVYLAGSMLAMTADSIEHVISYWMIFQKFHSPALGGYAVLSHWLPFLLFSIYSGSLADRFDPRRIIQVGMVLFMLCSLA